MSIKVSFRKDRKKYEVRYYLNGERKRPLFDSKIEADNFARKVSFGLPVEDQNSITIDAAGKKYFAAESEKKSPKSKSNDKRYINLHHYFMTQVRGIERLGSIGLEDMEAFRDWLPTLRIDPTDETKSMRMGNATVNRCLRVMKHIYRKHTQWKDLDESPCIYLEFLEHEERARAVMTSDEYIKTLEKAEGWLKPVLQFMYLSGSPAICIERLNWADVDLAKRSYSTLRRKGRNAAWKRSYFGMTDDAFALFVMLRNQWPAVDGPVFRDSHGRPLLADRVTRAGNDAIRAAGVKGVTLYGSRHALATDMTAANISTEIVRQAMGHASITTTQRYANKIGLRSVTGAIESVRGGNLVANEDYELRHKMARKGV